MSYIKVYIHLVWSTKNRIPFLNSHELRTKVWKHIFEYAKEKEIFIDHINGYSNHCHCLISLGSNQSLSQVVHLIKGEATFWINSNKLTKGHFNWQNEYYAVSVSPSLIQKTRNYLKNQELHHANSDFNEELKLIEKSFNKYE